MKQLFTYSKSQLWAQGTYGFGELNSSLCINAKKLWLLISMVVTSEIQEDVHNAEETSNLSFSGILKGSFVNL